MKTAAALRQAPGLARSVLQARVLPLVLLVLANLAAGLLVYQDYGLAWDEPLFYQYADAIGYAYSIQERLSGGFDLERAYGPSSDHGMYGPAYLLLARPVVGLLGGLLPGKQSDLWHLVNFSFFQLSLFLFYGLARYWAGRWAALAAALFFAAQPVIWGFAWINPKDMPFMIFFMAAVYYGMKMVDRLGSLPLAAEPAPSQPTLPQPVRRFFASPRLAGPVRLLPALAAGLSALVVFLFVLQRPLESGIAGLVAVAYQAAPESLVGKVFSMLASQAGQVPLESYVHKSLVLFARLRLGLALLAVGLLPLAARVRWPGFYRAAVDKILAVLAPLPRLPEIWIRGRNLRPWLPGLLLGAGFLGLVSSIRVLGPLAGVLVGIYFLARFERRSWMDLSLYALVGLVFMYLTWPFLWPAPLARFWEVFSHMSNNPQILSVIFNGGKYFSDELPRVYLPLLLGITLTEPVGLLAGAGLLALAVRVLQRQVDWRTLLPLLLWFGVPFLYVVLTKPPMYDGYRHFLFILPPVFLLTAAAFEWVRRRMPLLWANALLVLVLAPGLVGILRTHPYQYTYFNSFVGGLGGAFRQYDTDFWLTCYREIMGKVNAGETDPVTLYVHRQPGIAREYAAPHIAVQQYEPEKGHLPAGSLLLLSSRTGIDTLFYPDQPAAYATGRDGAVFCLVRRIE
jgi:hypothetical protein